MTTVIIVTYITDEMYSCANATRLNNGRDPILLFRLREDKSRCLSTSIFH